MDKSATDMTAERRIEAAQHKLQVALGDTTSPSFEKVVERACAEIDALRADGVARVPALPSDAKDEATIDALVADKAPRVVEAIAKLEDENKRQLDRTMGTIAALAKGPTSIGYEEAVEMLTGTARRKGGDDESP